jgi:hypothetical protein
MDAVARLLVEAGADRSNPDGSPRCSIVDIGHQRDLELPDDELGAVASADKMGETTSLKCCAPRARPRAALKAEPQGGYESEGGGPS